MNPQLKKLQKLLQVENLDAVLISSLPNITYLTNFFGFSTEDRDAYLLITKTTSYIFTHGIYKEAVEKQVKNFDLIPITRENPIGAALKKIVTDEKVKKIGFESFDLKINEYERLTKHIDKKILTPTNIIHNLRIIKSSDEIQAIKKACELGDKTFSHILKNIKATMTEKELAFEIEFFIKKQGADISFPPVVAFGANASQPHHVATDIKLKNNTLVLVDFGVKLNNYCSDMTRTFFFGKATEEQKKVYQIVLESQQKAINYIISSFQNAKSLIKATEVDHSARQHIMDQDFPSMPHSLGHGIGLEVHELPRLTMVSEDILKPGMVFSIEPGIYLPDEFGVRIEDLYAIENKMLVQLTNAPKRLTEI